ncbi:tetratricopeptide repeat protein [Oceanithermus sp.]
MRRMLFALASALGLALAGGLVFPFDGAGGQAAALAVADAVGAPSPVLAEIAFPETPWPQGWSVVMGDPNGPGGARLAAEATGADWVLVGRMEPDGWIAAWFYRDGRAEPARFTDVGLLASWLALKLERPLQAATPYPELDPALARLAEGDVAGARTYLEQLNLPASERLDREVAAVEALYAHGPAVLAGVLPDPVIDYWAHRKVPEQMGNAGMGPVWKAFFPLLDDDRAEAGRRARALLASERALDLVGADLLLHALGDPAWGEAARRLTEVAPELTFGWEELSFAAFEADDAATAARALERALELEPDSALYWTNLGWARYLLGDLPGAVAASLRAMALDPNPTAAYNLGLFAALTGDHASAFDRYLEALRLDDEGVAPMALEDLVATGRSDMRFWMGFLLERTGRNAEAIQAYQDFLAAHPDHALASRARAAIAALERAQVLLTLEGFRLGPVDTGFDVGTGEPLAAVLTAATDRYLPTGEVELVVYDGAREVARSRTPVDVPPLTSGWTRELEPVAVEEPGRYRVVTRYAGAEAEAVLLVRPGHLGRRLLGAGIVPRALSGAELVAPEVLTGPEGEQRLLEAAVREVNNAAAGAAHIERFSHPLEEGPFAGKSVAQVMATADADLLRRFFEAALERPEMLLDQDVANAFASWLLKLR